MQGLDWSLHPHVHPHGARKGGKCRLNAPGAAGNDDRRRQVRARLLGTVSGVIGAPPQHSLSQTEQERRGRPSFREYIRAPPSIRLSSGARTSRRGRACLASHVKGRASSWRAPAWGGTAMRRAPSQLSALRQRPLGWAFPCRQVLNSPALPVRLAAADIGEHLVAGLDDDQGALVGGLRFARPLRDRLLLFDGSLAESGEGAP